MKDTDLMPFGVHKGTTMANVPARYLIWLYDIIRRRAPNKMKVDEKDIVKYVEENKDVLEKELSEGKNYNP